MLQGNLLTHGTPGVASTPSFERVELDAATEQVNVALDDAGDHRLHLRIDDAGVLGLQAGDVMLRTDAQDAVALDGERLGAGLFGVHGQDAGVGDQDVGRSHGQSSWYCPCKCPLDESRARGHLCHIVNH